MYPMILTCHFWKSGWSRYAGFAGCLLLLCLFSAGLSSCRQGNKDWEAQVGRADFLHRSVYRLTEVIVHDFFSPPVASRIYAYPAIAAYEAMVPGYPGYSSMAGQLNGLNAMPVPEQGKAYSFPLAGVVAYLKVGQRLISSEDSIAHFREQLFREIKAAGIPADIFDRSVAYGDSVGSTIIAWLKKDQYDQTRSYPLYSVTNAGPGEWTPTPPMYAAALEPHWRLIRPMAMDSAQQFKPAAPTPYSTDKASRFYKEALEVYQSVKDSTPDRVAKAKYWDDSPFSLELQGHMSFAIKKITPPGHWMNITRKACEKAKADMMKSAEAYCLAGICIFDGIISCWDEKYRSNLIRPETYINEHIDNTWRPILQTPPFPEHTSGHSVISGAASVVLTALFGEGFSFTDDTETRFNMPERHFNSFSEAADEAAISRMYGGIHYTPAIEIGVAQGREVAAFVLNKLKKKN